MNLIRKRFGITLQRKHKHRLLRPSATTPTCRTDKHQKESF